MLLGQKSNQANAVLRSGGLKEAGEIPMGSMGKQVCGSARLRPFCWLLVVGSAVSIGTVGAEKAEPLHRLQPQDFSSHSSCDIQFTAQIANFAPRHLRFVSYCCPVTF